MRIPRRLAGIAAVGLAAAMALAACSDDEGGGSTVEGSPGWDNCEGAQENTCNSGERAEGGEMTVLISLPWEKYNLNRSEGNSVYTLQALWGIFPYSGQFLPDGTWQWNMDLFETEPTMISEDPQTMEYRIRDEAVWSDGTPIGIDDFLYFWYHNSGLPEHCTDACSASGSGSLPTVESIVGSDDGKTITVTYKPGSYDPEWFATFGSTNQPFYPGHIAEEAGFDWKNDPDEMLASSEWFRDTMPTWSGGPYMIESAVMEERVVKVPNPQWYGEVKPTLERYTAEVIADPASWIPALENRDIHAGSPATFDVNVYRQLDTVSNIYYTAGAKGAVWEHIDFNVENEQLADVALRQAIFTVIDIQDLADSIWGTDVPYTLRTNHIFTESSQYHQDVLTPTGQGAGDVQAALDILTSNGYEFDEDSKTLTKDGEKVGPFRIRWTEGNTNRATIAELVQSYAADIGVELVLQAHPNLGEMLSSQDYDLAIFGWSGSPTFTVAPDQYWNSKSDSNYGGYSNPEVDDLVAQVLSQTDVAVSAELANEVAAIVAQDAYVLPLWDSPQFGFVADDYVNVRENFNASLRMYYGHEGWGVIAN